jgi:hypothetical protein
MTPCSTDTLGSIQGWILIDCWEPAAERLETDERTLQKTISQQQLFDRMIQMHDFFQVRSVINAAYNNRLVYDGANSTADLSILNTIKRYAWDDHTQNNSIITNLVKYSRGRNDSARLLTQIIMNNDHSYMLLDADDFVWHWEHCLDRGINHWLVLGQSWQICTHDRPMGFRRMREIARDTGINFYTTEWAIIHEDGSKINALDFRDDDLDWEVVQGFGYRLMP